MRSSPISALITPLTLNSYTIKKEVLTLKDLKATRGSRYIRSLIEEGEHEHQDFKFAINDARKIARSLSAFANNDGGRLLVGVKDNGVVAGLRNEEDLYVVEQAAELYCRPTPAISFATFTVEGGAVVLRVEIERSEERPVLASDTPSLWQAYYRVADENIVAHRLMVRGWRMALGEKGLTMQLGTEERILLDMLAEGDTSEVEFARRASISSRRADSIVATLYAMKVIDFRYINGSFRIVAR